MSDNRFFTKQTDCPVCHEHLEITKIRSSAVRVEKQDEDFCPHYKEINPLFYGVLVCSNCGYSNFEDKFEEISNKDIKKVNECLRPKWQKQDFSGERDVNIALNAFKLLLLNAQVRGLKNSEIAKICIRIAWMYRYLGDPKETDFLRHALTAYSETFEKESLPHDNLDEITCMYMIGELNRRLGDRTEASKWFYKIITAKNPNVIDKAKANLIINMSREQIQNLRENAAE